MTSSATAVRAASRPRLRAFVVLASAAVIAIVIDVFVAQIAVAAGAPAGYGPLSFPAYALFSALGIAGGWLGWTLVRRHARDAPRVLTALVPVVTVLSLVPDVLLLVFRFVPGTTTSAAVALIAMHLVVVAVAVPAYVLADRRGR